MKGVKTIIKIIENLLSWGFTKENPLTHTRKEKDGYQEYLKYQFPLKAGKTYLLSARCDGTLSYSHDTNGKEPSKKYFSLWIVGSGFNYFYGGNNLFYKNGNRYTWKVQIPGDFSQSEGRLRVNTYSDGNTPVTVHVWDVEFYELD